MDNWLSRVLWLQLSSPMRRALGELRSGSWDSAPTPSPWGEGHLHDCDTLFLYAGSSGPLPTCCTACTSTPVFTTGHQPSRASVPRTGFTTEWGIGEPGFARLLPGQHVGNIFVLYSYNTKAPRKVSYGYCVTKTNLLLRSH